MSFFLMHHFFNNHIRHSSNQDDRDDVMNLDYAPPGYEIGPEGVLIKKKENKDENKAK
jgi:hypothetical protein